MRPTTLRCDSAVIKGDQAQVGRVVVHTRSEVRSPRSELGGGGRAVALMVALLSYRAAQPKHALLSSDRSGKHVRVWGFRQALRALREVAEKMGRNPKEYALHSLRIGSASTLAAGGDVSERVIQREDNEKGGGSPCIQGVHT